MACTLCLSQVPSSACQFSLITALDSIKIHYTAMEKALKEKTNELKNMEDRNYKLMKAIDCLKKPETLVRMTSSFEDLDKSLSQQSSSDRAFRTDSTPSPVFEDITIIDDDEEDNILMSVMDTALNGSALNTSATNNNDVITETESPKVSGAYLRRIGLKLGLKKTVRTKKTRNNNDENKMPAINSLSQLATAAAAKPTKSEEIKNDKQTDWTGLSKQKVEASNKQKLKRLCLKQTKLVFEDKRERTNPVEEATTSHKKSLNKNDESKIDSDEDMFNLNSTSTFQFKSPSPKKPKLRNFNSLFCKSPLKDGSVEILPSPTQTIYFLDDTNEVKTDERKASPGGYDSADKTVDFGIRKENQESRSIESTSEYRNKAPPLPVQQEEPIQTIKKELFTQARDQKPVNPIFNYTETEEEESDDEFVVRPIQVKIEPPENIEFIDINTIDCKDCRNYINFCGNRMTAAKLQEHIRNCLSHNKQQEVLRAETPEGFWNPLLESFAQSDPRNEVLLDYRFKQKKTVSKDGKNN